MQNSEYKPFFQMISPISMDNILLSRGFISVDTLELVKKEGKDPAQYLISEGFMTEDDLADCMAEYYGVPYLLPTEINANRELMKTIGAEIMQKFRFLPLDEEKGEIKVAMADPGDLTAIENIETLLRKRVNPVAVRASDIDNTISLAFDAQSIIDETIDSIDLELMEDDPVETDLRIEQLRDDSNPIIKLVNSIIFNAIEKRASDIHIESYERIIKVKYRIDGALVEAMKPIDISARDVLVSRIKVISELNIAERRIPQDGRFKLKVKGRDIDFRVSVLPSIFGETVVIRILDRQALSLSLGTLGFNGQALIRFRRQINRPYGMILVAGPTGSGKTTTLYSALREIHKPEDKVITIEDPVEYMLPDIVQIPIDEKKGMTFARGLRAIVRQDPDKIMVGEIRDLETAEIAINAALTGHLVLSTIHSNNVVDTVGRLINIGVEPYQFVASFNMIMAQRLIRKICTYCIDDYNGPYSQQYPELELKYGRGCEYCHGTGYFDRIGIFEVMELSEEIKQLILENKSPMELREKARSEGMQLLRESCLEKVAAGLTSIEEMNRVTS